MPDAANGHLWGKLIDKSLALVITFIVLYAGFKYHVSVVTEYRQFLEGKIWVRLDDIERKIEKCK